MKHSEKGIVDGQIFYLCSLCQTDHLNYNVRGDAIVQISLFNLMKSHCHLGKSNNTMPMSFSGTSTPNKQLNTIMKMHRQ